MEYKHKVLIGGRAMNVYRSSRLTQDSNYLIFHKDSFKPYIRDEKNNIDYINANGSNFFKEIWDMEKENQVASPKALLELKVYSYVQHLLNGNFNKANDSEYDIKFLMINFDLKGAEIVKKYLSKSEMEEISRFFKNIKRPLGN